MHIPPSHSCLFCQKLVVDLRESNSSFDHTIIPGHRVQGNLHLFWYHFPRCRLYHALVGYLLGCPLMRLIFAGWENYVFSALDADDDYELCLSANISTSGSDKMNLQTIGSFCIWDSNKERRQDMRSDRSFNVWARAGQLAN